MLGVRVEVSVVRGGMGVGPGSGPPPPQPSHLFARVSDGVKFERMADIKPHLSKASTSL